MKPEILLNNLNEALNNHDIEAFLKCFSTNYTSEQPVHPARLFRGKEQVRKNWSLNFQEMPDFRSKILRHINSDNTIWVEWEWNGTRQDGSKLQMCGVSIFGIEQDEISWGRLYVEPIQADGEGIDIAIKEIMHGKKNE